MLMVLKLSLWGAVLGGFITEIKTFEYQSVWEEQRVLLDFKWFYGLNILLANISGFILADFFSIKFISKFIGIPAWNRQGLSVNDYFIYCT